MTDSLRTMFCDRRGFLESIRGISAAGLGSLPFARLPTLVDPKPVSRIAADGGFESAVDVEHDRFCGARFAIVVSADFLAEIDAPAGQREAVTNCRKNPASITQRQERRRGTGETI